MDVNMQTSCEVNRMGLYESRKCWKVFIIQEIKSVVLARYDQSCLKLLGLLCEISSVVWSF